MIARIVTWSLQHRLLVIAITLIVVASGAWSLRRLPIDAYPDRRGAAARGDRTAAARADLDRPW
jgi:Cu/Ag efflux pump CusA